MNIIKSSIAMICTTGIFAVGTAAFAAPESSNDTANLSDQSIEKQDESLTSIILSFFANDDEKKDIGPEISLLKKPAKENAGQYITLSEPTAPSGLNSSKKTLIIQRSFAAKPSLIFNIGSAGFSHPSGYTSLGASTTGQRVTFSYGNSDAVLDHSALGISIGSQFLIEPSSIMSPLYEGSEFDQINDRQAYNLSVDMGYAGFKLGASFSQEKTLYRTGLKGFDVGLGYAGRKWQADVKLGEYKRERDLFFASTEEFFDRVYALEIGAAYQLYSNIRFTGRFTYYAYGQENDLDALRNSQVFFLGTNVNF